MNHHITEKRNLGGISGHKYKNTNGPKNKHLFFLITPVGSISLLRNLIDGALLSTLALVIGNLCSENKAVVCFSSYCMHAQS